MVAGFSVPAPTSVLNGCTTMQPRSVQYFVSASSASCMVSTTNLKPSSGGFSQRSLLALARCHAADDQIDEPVGLRGVLATGHHDAVDQLQQLGDAHIGGDGSVLLCPREQQLAGAANAQ